MAHRTLSDLYYNNLLKLFSLCLYKLFAVAHIFKSLMYKEFFVSLSADEEVYLDVKTFAAEIWLFWV